jgi:hypothetical protein
LSREEAQGSRVLTIGIDQTPGNAGPGVKRAVVRRGASLTSNPAIGNAGGKEVGEIADLVGRAADASPAIVRMAPHTGVDQDVATHEAEEIRGAVLVGNALDASPSPRRGEEREARGAARSDG